VWASGKNLSKNGSSSITILRKEASSDLALLTEDALNRAFDQTDQILSDVSKQKQVELIDASSVVSGRSEFFLDEVHLTDRGGEVLSDLVATSLEKVLHQAELPAHHTELPAHHTGS
jgi:lysophospholipase L1-like esterase